MTAGRLRRPAPQRAAAAGAASALGLVGWLRRRRRPRRVRGDDATIDHALPVTGAVRLLGLGPGRRRRSTSTGSRSRLDGRGRRRRGDGRVRAPTRSSAPRSWPSTSATAWRATDRRGQEGRRGVPRRRCPPTSRSGVRHLRQRRRGRSCRPASTATPSARPIAGLTPDPRHRPVRRRARCPRRPPAPGRRRRAAQDPASSPTARTPPPRRCPTCSTPIEESGVTVDVVALAAGRRRPTARSASSPRPAREPCSPPPTPPPSPPPSPRRPTRSPARCVVTARGAGRVGRHQRQRAGDRADRAGVVHRRGVRAGAEPGRHRRGEGCRRGRPARWRRDPLDAVRHRDVRGRRRPRSRPAGSGRRARDGRAASRTPT